MSKRTGNRTARAAKRRRRRHAWRALDGAVRVAMSCWPMQMFTLSNASPTGIIRKVGDGPWEPWPAVKAA